MKKQLTHEEAEKIWNEIRTLVIEGCTVQGGHHKAYYLDQLARKIFMDDAYEIFSKLDDWDKGIAP